MNPSSPLRPWLPVLALAARLAAQAPATPSLTEVDPTIPPARRAASRAEDPIAQRVMRDAATLEDRVLFDQPGDGRIWASGATYKASFGAEGFLYVPFFGSKAPRNWPVRFALRSVSVGGRGVTFAADATATRDDARVTFDRGLVREIYDLSPRGVEQTFVVDGSLPGDVDVELEVSTDLTEDAAQAGVQFCNELGRVDYGTAYLVCGATKSEIPATVAGRSLRLHVPAAQRGAGPVVIDPVITTQTFAPTLRASEVPDIAYDASTDRWMVAWIHIFSATDHDVVAELRAANGDAVPGSFKLIDNSTQSYSFPRVANLNSVDRFLIAMERIPQVTGEVFSVWGRTVDAGSPFGTSGLFEISPNSNLHQNNVDVGGDPGTGTRWTVAWIRGTDVVARQVNADGSLLPNVIPITASTTQCINPNISISNGNGQTATPCWCIVFNRQTAANVGDIMAVTMDLNGSLMFPPRRIDNAGNAADDLFGVVSSPMIGPGGSPRFMVAYYRQGTPAEMIVKVIDSALNTVVPEVSLTRRYGFGGDFFRVESDGLRFAALCQIGTTLKVGTLALVNNDIVLHESLQNVNTGGWPFIASKRSGGGGPTDYGIAFVNTGFTPFRVGISLYEGRVPGNGINNRGTGCGLGLSTTGRPALGDTLRFALTNPGSDIAGLLLGVPMPDVQICNNCRLGVDPTRSLTFFASPLVLPLPSDPLLVGVTPAIQGFGFGSGTCGDALRLSNTVEFTIQ